MISDYLGLTLQEKILDKISETLGINKKTTFDWRHKILAALDNDDFTRIIESDEIFFPRSEKGIQVNGRKSRKRSVRNGQVAIIVTKDRKSTLDLKVATLGRIGNYI